MQELSDLQAHAGVLQQQVVKMQAALTRADDVSIQLEDALEDAIAGRSDGDEGREVSVCVCRGC